MLRKINWLKDGNGSAKVAARHLGKTREFCQKFWPYAKYFDAAKYPKYAEYIDKEISSIVSQWETEEQILKSRIKHNTTAIQDWLAGKNYSINLWGRSFEIHAHNNTGLMLKALLGYITHKKLKTPTEIQGHLMGWLFKQPEYLCHYMPPYGDYLYSDSSGYYSRAKPKQAFKADVLMKDLPEGVWELFKKTAHKLVKESLERGYVRKSRKFTSTLPELPKGFLAGSKSPYFSEQALAHTLSMRPVMRLLPYIVSAENTDWLTAHTRTAGNVVDVLSYLPEGYDKILVSSEGLSMLRMFQLAGEPDWRYDWYWKNPSCDELHQPSDHYTETFNAIRTFLKGN